MTSWTDDDADDADAADDADDADAAGDAGDALGWVPWSLVAVAALPPLVLAEVGRRFLTGGADAAYFGTYVSEADVRARLGFTFSVRFRLFWATVPVPEVLLAALPPVLALCALVLAGRPGALVPGRWGRRVAAAAGVLTALESLLCLVMLFDLADEPRSDEVGNVQFSYLLPSTGEFPEVAPILALLVVTLVLSGVAALLLWRAGDPAPGPGAGPAAEPQAELHAEPPAGPDAEPEVGIAPPPPPTGPPTVSPEERAAYRRPGS